MIRAAERFLFAPGSGRRLLITQVALAAVIGLRIAFGPFLDLADQPPALFRPVSFLRILDAMPGLATILTLQVGGTLAAAAAVAGWRRRATFPTAWVCLLVLAGLRSSQGKLLHNDLLLLLAAVPFLAAPAVRRQHADDRLSARFGWPVRTATVVVAGAYFFSGLAKMIHSGPAWVLSDSMRHVLDQAAGGGKVAFPEVPAWLAGQAGLAHGLAAGVLLLELTFPIVLLARSRRVSATYAISAVALHAGTWLVLGLDYWAWAAVTAAVLVDGRPVIERLSRYRLRWRPRLLPPAGNPAGPADVVPAQWREKAEDRTCENAAAGAHASVPPRSPPSPSPSS
ncbi:MAG TPA: hypothetical protein VF244_11075 [Acidimicrobiales bacterium]